MTCNCRNVKFNDVMYASRTDVKINLSQKKKLIDNLEEGLKNGKKKMFNFDNSQKPN